LCLENSEVKERGPRSERKQNLQIARVGLLTISEGKERSIA